MRIPQKLKKGDKVAIVSLSSGMLGETYCEHNLQIGTERLKAMGLIPVCMKNTLMGTEYLEKHPEKRAEDLKSAFCDTEIKGILCAIGGEDTYRTLPYLLEDKEFVEAVRKQPKLFTGFSDTTINHFMFYKLGMQTYYGPAFICDLAEIASEMLPYTQKAFAWYLSDDIGYEITPSPIWYEERTDFSVDAVGTDHISHKEIHGYELLQGAKRFDGELLGGCLESMYQMLTDDYCADEKAICEKYKIFPEVQEWKGKILFLETCEVKPNPELLAQELAALKKRGIFDVIHGIIVGKPQDETFYEEYKAIYKKIIDNPLLPVLYNVNFGHALPRTVLPYGAIAQVDAEKQKITILNA